MNNIKNVFLLSCLCLILLSCTKNGGSTSITVSLGKADDSISMSSFFKSISVIPLSEQEDYIMNGIGKLRYANDLYYVLDNEGKQIVSFDGKGRQQSVFSRQGHGHEEYLNIYDFDISSQNIFILCVPSKIYVTDKNLKLQRTIDINDELLITRICITNDNLYLYSSNTRTLYCMDDKDEISTIMQEAALPVCPYEESGFYNTGEELLYASRGCDTVYVINESEAKPLFTIDYPNKSESFERFKQNKLLEWNEKLKYSAVAIRSIIDVGDYWFLSYTYSFLYRWCLIDKADKSLVKDGNITTLLFPRSRSGNKTFSWGYVSKEKNPADSLNMKVNMLAPINQIEGNLAIMVYE